MGLDTRLINLGLVIIALSGGLSSSSGGESIEDNDIMAAPVGRQLATLAGGCFWCIEAVSISEIYISIFAIGDPYLLNYLGVQYAQRSGQGHFGLYGRTKGEPNL